MQNITNKLSNHAELWGMADFKNELDELDRKEAKIKDIYCNILPSGSTKQNTPVTEGYNFSHKFTVRKKSIDDIKLDMFFVFREQKYLFKYWNEDFKNNEFYEIFTEMKLE